MSIQNDYQAGKITREEAREMIFKSPTLLKYLFKDFFKSGIITRKEALPFALAELKRTPTDTKILDFYRDGLLKAGEASEAIESVCNRAQGYNLGQLISRFEKYITKEQARTFALKALADDAWGAERYYKKGYISQEELKPFLLQKIATSPSYAKQYITEGLLTADEAKNIVFANPTIEAVRAFLEERILTAQEIKPYVEQSLMKDPKKLASWAKLDIFTDVEIREVVKRIQSAHPSLTLSKSFASKVLGKFQSPVFKQLRKAGVNVESLIDPDLRFLLNDIH